ncbi:MAG: DUF1538 family protein [Rhodospirillaceae bacterium]
MPHFRSLILALVATLRDLLPILLTIGIFQVLVLGSMPEDPVSLLGGLVAVLLGLTLLVRGLEMSLFPIGEALVDAMARHGRPAWLLGFAFALGFGSTVAEPALAAVASEAATAMVADPGFPATESQRAVLALQIRYGVAVGLGLALMLGVWRILKGWPLIWLVLPGYGVVALVAFFTDAPFVAAALDAGTAATSAINVPLMLALGVGLASVLRSRSPLVDGFGIVVLASLVPMLLFLAAGFLLVPGG